MVKIFIDAGHGGHDGGAIANGLKEKDLTLEIARKLRSELNKYRNVQVKMSRTGDTFLSLSRRANIANSWGADLFVSIHINAGGGVGYEDYIHTSQNSKTKSGKIQSCINAEMIKATGWRNRGRKRANFAVLRQTKMPAILTENGFIDTKTDADKLKSNSFLNKIADGHAKGIAKHFGLKKKKGSSSTTSKKKSNKKKTTSNSSKVSSYKGKRVESKVNGLRFYNKPSWKDKDVIGRVNKGYGFPNIVSKHKVGKGYQYKVKNSKGKVFYITASDKYVRVVGGSKKRTGKTISQMADEVIKGKHGSGNANRRRSLGISKSQYEKVRKEVNRRM